MSKIQKFEDLLCWQAARKLVKDVYVMSNEGKLATDYSMKDQLRRAALSVMNNIAEGFGRFGNKDFIRFLDISQSSAQEVQSMLYVLSDLSYLSDDKIELLRARNDEAKKLTLGLIKYLRGRK